MTPVVFSTPKEGMFAMIVGIDLGTTNSQVAFLSENGPTLIPNAHGEFLTPSAVALTMAGRLS